MDRIDAMETFVRVVETGSFTRAAETLQTSRTRVTQLVQALETHLRVKLLHRTTRKVNVTADGAAYYERVVRLLADLDDAETSLSGASAVPRGRFARRCARTAGELDPDAGTARFPSAVP